MAIVGAGAPGFYVFRDASPVESTDLPYLGEPGYFEMDLLEPYYRSDRPEIPLGRLEPGSREALLAMRYPIRVPRRPAAFRMGYERSLAPLYLGVALLLAAAGGAGIIAHQIISMREQP